MYYIGIDLGTSAVKLLLMEESGKICNIVSKEYPLYFPHPGWSEQNPSDWFEKSMPDAWAGNSGQRGSGDPSCNFVE